LALSIAAVAQSGPFSDFSGYDRSIMLVEGKGFTLEFAEAEPITWSGVSNLALRRRLADQLHLDRWTGEGLQPDRAQECARRAGRVARDRRRKRSRPRARPCSTCSAARSPPPIAIWWPATACVSTTLPLPVELTALRPSILAAIRSAVRHDHRPAPPYHFFEGTTPLLISIPHVGTDLPPEVEAGLSDAARPLPDTDWHLTRLYDFAGALGASVLGARYSRFTIDLNRPPDDKPLYATATTGLYPTSCSTARRPSNPVPQPSAEQRAFYLPRSGVRTTRRSATS
jgi:hypothetical protein